MPKANCGLCDIVYDRDEMLNISGLNILTPDKWGKQLIRLELVCRDCWSPKNNNVVYPSTRMRKLR